MNANAAVKAAQDNPATGLLLEKQREEQARADARRSQERFANAIRARNGWGALIAGLQRGLRGPLLLAWMLVTLLPALVAAVPVMAWLHSQFGHSPQAAAIAAGREALLLVEALNALNMTGAALAGGGALAMLLAVALSPWLSGMIVAQIRTVYPLRMGGVLRAGLGEYPRMLRMLLWSLVPMGLAVVLGIGVVWVVQGYANSPLSYAQAMETAPRLSLLPLAVLLLIAHVTVEAARGWLGADLALHSVLEAWKRGVLLLIRRPVATLIVYLGTSAVGYGLAAVFGWLRLQLDGTGGAAWLLAFVLTQLVVAALAWGRSARLHGLADLATAAAMSQSASQARASEEEPTPPPEPPAPCHANRG